MPKYRFRNGNVTIEIAEAYGNLEFVGLNGANYGGNLQFNISQNDVSAINLLGIVVKPHGQGLGPLLIKFMIEHYGEGVDRICLVAMEQPARTFFEGLGFVNTNANTPGVYEGAKNAVIENCRGRCGNWMIVTPGCVVQ